MLLTVPVARMCAAVLAVGLFLTACGEADSEVESASFSIEGSEAFMSGVIDGSTPDEVSALLVDYPDVDTIVMLDVPGSDNDAANLEASRLIRDAGIATHVPADGQIASGGVDFFLAGETRTYDSGATFSVHSWAAGDGLTGADLLRDDPEHDLYLDYYEAMGIDEDFYWFTLEAAPADSFHDMTEAELETFNFQT